MTHPDGRPYTREERRAIVEDARATAAALLAKLERLARMDGAVNEVGAPGGTEPNGASA